MKRQNSNIRSARRLFMALALAGAASLSAGEAHAQGANDGQALALAKQAIDEHYLAMDMEKAVQTLKKALDVCKDQCSAKALASIHRDLAVVYIAGMNKAAEGEQEMKLAVATDPTVQLNPDLATPEVKAVYEKVGGKPGAAPVESSTPADAGTDEAAGGLDESVSVSEDDLEITEDPSGEGGAAKKHWLSVAGQFDFLIHRNTVGACASQTTTGSPAYVCKNDLGQTWGWRGEDGIDPSEGNNTVQTGIAPSTKRIMLGYDYTLSDNLVAGARLGLAFGGAVHDELADEAAFFPYHLEARAQYFLGDAPLASAGFRPYAGLGAGLGQFDSFVQVEFFTANDPGPNGQKYTINAWRRAGNTFVALALGGEYALTPAMAIFAEFQAMQLFGQAANVLALRVGGRYGL